MKPLRPFQHACRILVERILKGETPPGSFLPAERNLAVELGVTRPTLREALQVLASEGWFQIQHGKPTKVAHYLESGSLSLLTRLADFPDCIPESIIHQLLEVRRTILPQVAGQSFEIIKEEIDRLFIDLPNGEEAEEWAHFDWQLQLLMLESSGNPFFKMIFNSFERLFEHMAAIYFSIPETRTLSHAYYRALQSCQTAVEMTVLVQKAMEESMVQWQKLNTERSK